MQTKKPKPHFDLTLCLNRTLGLTAVELTKTPSVNQNQIMIS